MDCYAKLEEFKPGTRVMLARCLKHDLAKYYPQLRLCDCDEKGKIGTVTEVHTDTPRTWDVQVECFFTYNHKQLVILDA